LTNTTSHSRINDTVMGPLERPALHWLAVHSPKWMNPDIYTAIGVAGSIIILVGYVLSRSHLGYFWLASFGFLVNWYGDSMDGTLARYRHIERPIYGFFVDHTTDAIGQVLMFLGLGLSPYISFNIACLTLVAYLLISILVYIRTYLVGEFKISYGKLGPTEVRVLAVLLNTAMFFFGEQTWQVKMNFLGNVILNPYDMFVGAIGFLLLFFFLNTTWQETIRLARSGK
jgi:archaetidylinositol phosphate synthase